MYAFIFCLSMFTVIFYLTRSHFLTFSTNLLAVLW